MGVHLILIIFGDLEAVSIQLVVVYLLLVRVGFLVEGSVVDRQLWFQWRIQKGIFFVIQYIHEFLENFLIL